jgi:penicillin-binding protein 1C
MNHLHQDWMDGLHDVPFPPPRGFAAHRLCALTGRRATAACDRVSLEWFRAGEAPPDPCTAHQRLAIDRRDGRPATPQTPAEAVEVRTFTHLGPRYAAWAAAAGLRSPLDIRRALEGGGPPGGTLARATARVRLAITAPETGARLLLDPEVPRGRSTMALRAVVDPPVPQAVWYVDGVPFQVVPYPYTVRWPLLPGEHTFQLRLPYRGEVSPVVSILVQ